MRVMKPWSTQSQSPTPSHKSGQREHARSFTHMHTDSPYLTIEEVIKATGLSRRTILKRVNAGLLNRYKSMSDARRYLYRREEVEALSAPTPV